MLRRLKEVLGDITWFELSDDTISSIGGFLEVIFIGRYTPKTDIIRILMSTFMILFGSKTTATPKKIKPKLIKNEKLKSKPNKRSGIES